ncbi:MAG: trypsin-like serine protease [Deltaproteobacteria bacterium]|nr:trypsin-like serine protease [Deltaproteobacteria bacterium]
MKLTLITMSILALLCCGCEEGSLSLESNRHSGIVGGEKTNHEIWKGVIAVVALNGDQPAGMCTGTLIHPDVVLTAGHCVLYNGTPPLEPNYDHVADPSGVVIKLGAKVGNMGGQGEVLAEVQEAIVHPTWTGKLDPGKAVDLALLHLKDSVDEVGTYCIREDTEVQQGDPGIIVGYGLLGTMQPNSAGTHRWGETTVRAVEEQTIEIGKPTATCQGDSGGPLFTKPDDRWEITGVTSYGGMICLPNKGAYMANVSNFTPWVNKILEDWTGDSLGECTEIGHDPPSPDAGPDTDTNTGSETDTEQDAGPDTDTGTGSETDTEEDAGPDTEEDAGSDTDTGTDSEPSTDAGDTEETSDDPGGCGCFQAGVKTHASIFEILF